jgi:hypothetical protein
VVLSVLILGTMLVSMAQPAPSIEPPEELLPGRPLLAGVPCCWPPVNTEDTVRCHAHPAHHVFLVYDVRRGVITTRPSRSTGRQSVR